jgi:hypothetical protein
MPEPRTVIRTRRFRPRAGASCLAALLLACGSRGGEGAAPLVLPTDAPRATLVFVGDVSGHGIVASENDPDPFAGAGPLLPEADVLVLNLEGVLSPPPHAPGDCAPLPGNHLLDAHPRLADFLARAPTTVATCANNHAMDCGAAGAASTQAALDARGIVSLGFGPDADAACRGASVRAGDVDVELLAYLDYPQPESATVAAAPGRAGVATWDACDAPRSIAHAAATGAYVVACLHLHADPTETAGKVRAALAAGADLVVGHGSHEPAGVIVLDGRVGLVGLGNFLFDPEAAATEPARDVATATVSLHADAVVVALRAGRLDAAGRPVPGTAEQRERILARVVRLSTGDVEPVLSDGVAYLVAPRR